MRLRNASHFIAVRLHAWAASLGPRWLASALLLLLPLSASAHVGSKDVFQTVHAGPYVLNVTIRPPNVIPGIAAVEIRSTGAALTGLHITPLPLTGEASKHPPAADAMQQSRDDPSFYTGGVWIMASGTWQVRIEADGPAGRETSSVPVVAVPIATLKMQPAMGFALAALGLFLIVSMAGVVAASIRESRLAPGVVPTAERKRRGFYAMLASLAVMILFVFLGAKWWNVEAASYAGHIFTPAVTTASLTGDQLDLNVQNYNPDQDLPERFRRFRSNKDYLPDHGKLIHLYAIREPQMDAAFHLHPTLVAPGDFRMALPAMPAGHYRLYGDVVHANGFPETLQATVDVPAGLPPAPLAAEDAEALPCPLSQGLLGTSYKLPDGYTMQWDRPASISATTPYIFHFRLLDSAGRPATDMQPYLGMAGHAAFVKTDGSVFAHTHPDGSAAMADVMLATPGDGSMNAMEKPGPIAPEVDFPYGFPTPGRYRIFIQMRHAGTVETGVFDAEVQ
jgi:hypothetical protein